LDAKLRVQMRASLHQLHERLGVTTVYVTHDQVEAMTLGDRVAVLKDGKLQQVDTPKNLFDHPVNLFVAGFIGSPAMNFVNARIEAENGGAALRFAEHVLHVSEESLREHPGLEKYFGREIILGIRPSDFDDANFASHRGSTINVTANVTEELGTEINVIFAVDAPPVQHEATAALAAGAAGNGDSDDAALPLAGENKTFFTARVNPRSSVRPGHPISLTVDTRRLH